MLRTYGRWVGTTYKYRKIPCKYLNIQRTGHQNVSEVDTSAERNRPDEVHGCVTNRLVPFLLDEYELRGNRQMVRLTEYSDLLRDRCSQCRLAPILIDHKSKSEIDQLRQMTTQ